MKHFIAILQFLAIFSLSHFLYPVKSEYNRKWVEIGNELFVIEPQSQFTWKQAVAECKKEQSNLIKPKGDYDYAKLKDVIKRNFKNYSSFWTNTQVKWTTVFHQIGLGKDQQNRLKCNKFDNSSGFKFLPENCDSQLGFICEKPLLQDFSYFNTKKMLYLVQPNQEFTCEEAYDQCEKNQMSLVVLKDYGNSELLRNYIFINYGSGGSFWFGYNNETHYNCATPRRGQDFKYNSKLGFICQRAVLPKRAMTMRHKILLIFVAVAAFLAIIMFIVVKCFCSKRLDTGHLAEDFYPDEIKVTDIK